MDHVEPLIKTTPHQPTFYIKKYIYIQKIRMERWDVALL